MRHYWRFTFYFKEKKKTRYFYGTEAIVERRANKTTGCRKSLIRLSKSDADYLKTEKNARFVELTS